MSADRDPPPSDAVARDRGIVVDGLTYPFRGSGRFRTFLVGSLLTYLGFLLLPLAPLLGYMERVLVHTVEGRDEPPAFRDWGELARNGVLKALVMGVYAAIPYVVATLVLLVLFVTVGAGFLGSLASLDLSSAGGILGALLSLSLTLLAVILVPLLVYGAATSVAYFLVPAATMNFAAEGSLRAAFSVSNLREVVFTRKYLLVMAVPVALQWAAHTATGVLASSVVGLLFVPPVLFYAHVAIYRMYGRAYVAAVDDPVGPHHDGETNDVAEFQDDPPADPVAPDPPGDPATAPDPPIEPERSRTEPGDVGAVEDADRDPDDPSGDAGAPDPGRPPERSDGPGRRAAGRNSNENRSDELDAETDDVDAVADRSAARDRSTAAGASRTEALHRVAERRLADGPDRFGFVATVKDGDEIAHEGTTTEDVVTSFDDLLRRYASRMDADLPPEETLTILFEASDLDVRDRER